MKYYIFFSDGGIIKITNFQNKNFYSELKSYYYLDPNIFRPVVKKFKGKKIINVDFEIQNLIDGTPVYFPRFLFFNGKKYTNIS